MLKGEIMDFFTPANRLVIITGHFGSGKTNIAVNLAEFLKGTSGKNVSLIDFDVVNPYFRAADSAAELEKAGVRCIIPEYANTNVDIPALPPEIYSVFDGALSGGYAVFDVGGDDTGAAALGAYRRYFIGEGYEMLCVFNMYRPLTSTVEDAVRMLRDIEGKSRLKCTGIINNSNLGDATGESTLADSGDYIGSISAATGLPLVFSSSVLRLDKGTEKRYEKEHGRIFYIKNRTKNLYGG